MDQNGTKNSTSIQMDIYEPFSGLANDNQSLCKQIEDALLHSPYLVVYHIHLILLGLTLLATGLLIQQYVRYKIIWHGNLLILLSNIVVIDFIYILAQFVWLLRYRIILLYYQNPCDLLTPLWMVCIYFGAIYVQSVAIPALHFCIMVERFRATALAANYENERQQLGWWMASTIWFISLAYLAFVIGTAYADSSIPRQFGVAYIASEYSTMPIFYVNIFTMALIIVTAFCDWRLTICNNQLRENRLKSNGPVVNYSLSLNYQLNENALTMRLILPVDVSFALLYSLYNGLVILIRCYRSVLSISDYRLYYNIINSILFFYIIMTTLLYIRFIRYVKRLQKRSTIEVRPAVEIGQNYFQNLQSQWNRGPPT